MDQSDPQILDARQFRRKFALGAAGLLAINFLSGVAAWSIQERVSANAVAIYDRAFISNNYIRAAQLHFREFATTADPARRADKLETALDALSVAVERADTPRSRAARAQVRNELAGLRGALDAPGNDAESKADALVREIDDLGREASAEGLKARDETESEAKLGGALLIGIALTTFVIAAVGLIALHALVNRIVQMANFDALTGLPKRGVLRSRLQEALRQSRTEGDPVNLMSLDLDRFKAVNDTLGHQFGDRLLVQVAERLTRTIGPDDVAARFGGDEFVVLDGENRSPDSVARLADTIIRAVGAPYVIDGQEVVVGASIGIATTQGDAEDAEGVLRKSDIALYRAKSDGKGCWRSFAETMNVEAQRRRLLELELRGAIENNRLEVHYQPLMDASDGEIAVCEALVRWRCADGSYVSPEEFIPLSEENGLIIPLSKFVLTQACRDAASWARNIRVAVNLSAAQFRVGNLVAVVQEALAETGMPAERLDLELTETVLMDGKADVIPTLHRLADLGVRISLDDFGTGYSSLAQLSSFPFHKVKIDRSFIRDVESRQDAAAIVRAVASMAGSLGIQTTAEGVERAEELEWVRANGCDEIQGFLISRPLNGSDIRALLGMGGPSAQWARAAGGPEPAPDAAAPVGGSYLKAARVAKGA